MTLQLTVRYSTVADLVPIEVCDQYYWPDAQRTLSQTGVYGDTIVNRVGCDSIIGIILTVHYRQQTEFDTEGCDSLLWNVNGRYYPHNGTYRDTLLTRYGCDSVLVMHLVLWPTLRDTVRVTVCDEYEWPLNGRVYRVSDVYSDTIPTVHHCDSIRNLNLTVNYTASNDVEVLACDSFYWHGRTYTRADTTDIRGHFSVSGHEAVFFSPGNLQYHVPTGQWKFAAQQYEYIGAPNQHLSDSQAGWIDLFGWGTSGWNSGAAAYMPSAASMDDGDYRPGNRSTSNLTGAYAQADWGMHNVVQNSRYTIAGQWRTLTADEWHYLMHLRPHADRRHTQATVCDIPGLILLPDRWEPMSGIPMQYQVISYRTNVYDASQWSQLERAGAVFLPASGWRYGNSVFDLGTSGNYWSASHGDADRAGYMGFYGSAVLTSALEYRSSGMAVRLVHDTTGSTATYLVPHSTQEGCDTLERLFLTIRHIRHGDTTVAAVCDSFYWAQTRTQYTYSGFYGDSIATPEGCDSVISLDLTVHYTGRHVSTVRACDQYVWNDSLHVTDGIYDRLLRTVDGCDSLDTLRLSVFYSNTDTTIRSVCDTTRWNNRIYTQSGTYDEHLLNRDGCDSLDVLELEVRYSTRSTQTEEHCDIFYWPLTDSTYLLTTVDSYTLPNAVGCDSVVYLDLLVHHRDTTHLFIHDCDRHLFDFDPYVYTGDTVLYQPLFTRYGCDSIVVHHLDLDTSVRTDLFDTVCAGTTVRLEWLECNRDSLYSVTLQTAAGCDSVVTLDLTVRIPYIPDFHYESDCSTLEYTLTADIWSPYRRWSVTPDNPDYLPDSLATRFMVRLNEPVTYTLTVGYDDAPQCLNTASVTLNPVEAVSASAEYRLIFPADYVYQLDLESTSQGATDYEWFLGGTWIGNESFVSWQSALQPYDTLCLVLHAFNENCEDWDTILIPMDNSEIWVPNAFTPSQLTNSEFFVRGWEIAHYEIWIYNRRGQMVYHSQDIRESWDGRHNGEDCPMGSYVYTIRYCRATTPNTWRSKTGSILLLR